LRQQSFIGELWQRQQRFVEGAALRAGQASASKYRFAQTGNLPRGRIGPHFSNIRLLISPGPQESQQ
jgi:hypothetical protein